MKNMLKFKTCEILFKISQDRSVIEKALNDEKKFLEVHGPLIKEMGEKINKIHSLRLEINPLSGYTVPFFYINRPRRTLEWDIQPYFHQKFHSYQEELDAIAKDCEASEDGYIYTSEIDFFSKLGKLEYDSEEAQILADQLLLNINKMIGRFELEISQDEEELAKLQEREEAFKKYEEENNVRISRRGHGDIQVIDRTEYQSPNDSLKSDRIINAFLGILILGLLFAGLYFGIPTK